MTMIIVLHPDVPKELIPANVEVKRKIITSNLKQEVEREHLADFILKNTDARQNLEGFVVTPLPDGRFIVQVNYGVSVKGIHPEDMRHVNDSLAKHNCEVKFDRSLGRFVIQPIK